MTHQILANFAIKELVVFFVTDELIFLLCKPIQDFSNCQTFDR